MRTKKLARSLCSMLIVGTLLLPATFTSAQYVTDFEDMAASPAGVPITGQDGFYIPAGTDSVDAFVYTFLDNIYGFVANPEGGDQFVAGEGPGSPTFSRAQRDVVVDGGLWFADYQVAAMYTGAAPSANNLGSFSLQPSTTAAGYIHLFSWVDPADPMAFNAFYIAYDAAGTQFAQPGASPGPAWENLELNHWYEFETDVDFDLNKIVSVYIRDMETGEEAYFEPADWYLLGGEAGGAPLPTGFRFFAGGGVAGNVVAWDNFAFEPAACPEDTNGDGTVDILDLLKVLAEWGTANPEADVNDDGVVDILDLLAVLAEWGPCD